MNYLKKPAVCIALTTLLSSTLSWAGPDDFVNGPVIEAFGKIAPIESDMPLSKHDRFQVAFDVAKAAEAGEVNRKFDSVARFINMNAAAGVKPKRIKTALIVHGGAAQDLTQSSIYAENHEGRENANEALIEALLANGTEIYLCGQTAAYYDIKASDLIPGVKMALSAMTAHALLQQDGYSLNPF